MKNMFNIFSKTNNTLMTIYSEDTEEQNTNLGLLKQYKEDVHAITIENKPFRLNTLIQILTDKVSDVLKDKRQRIYYDIDKHTGRYIVGDYKCIEQILFILTKHTLLMNTDATVILKMSKEKNKFLIFEIVNHSVVMSKEVYQHYKNAFQFLTSQSESLNSVVYAKKIANAMNSSIELKSNKKLGTQYILKIPYYIDKDFKSHKEELQRFLAEKKALFIGRDTHDMERAQYIFETYGIQVDTVELGDFETKKPNLEMYHIVIIRSTDLSYKHISFLKNIVQIRDDFTVIVMHELFENQTKIKLAKSIADAELYCPIVIGDVEEILYHMFILQSKSVKGINNRHFFNTETFVIQAKSENILPSLKSYGGSNVAVVTHNKSDEQILQDILMDQDITLFCMKNGKEMIELLYIEEIDIVFTDIHLPIMNGIAMAKEIRHEKKWNHIPIIGISPLLSQQKLKNIELSGINAMILKPIQKKDVYKALKIFLVMTEKIRTRKKGKNRINFIFDKKILDIEKGIQASKTHLDYYNNLVETIEFLKSTKDSFETMILEEEFTSLGQYTRTALSKYEAICAPMMIKMFKDLTYFISLHQRKYLVDYIDIYNKNWEALQNEVNKYMKSEHFD